MHSAGPHSRYLLVACAQASWRACGSSGSACTAARTGCAASWTTGPAAPTSTTPLAAHAPRRPAHLPLPAASICRAPCARPALPADAPPRRPRTRRWWCRQWCRTRMQRATCPRAGCAPSRTRSPCSGPPRPHHRQHLWSALILAWPGANAVHVSMWMFCPKNPRHNELLFTYTIYMGSLRRI